ncbi:MAG: hypothetical protein F4164_04635 [Gemmatimonadales bacterium]|nr:hypothetical protein [Gemmatimonadales bacterium]MYG48656.1 hypothetical protein [Gemmatimonadales bacterium]
MPEPKAHTSQTGPDVGRTRADDRRSRARVQPSGATDGITITRWSLGLSLTMALTVVTAAFTLVWSQTERLGETQMQLVAGVAGLVERTGGLETRVGGLETRVGGVETRVGGLETRVAGLESEVRDLREDVREEIGGLREEIRELADLIRARELSGPPAQ